MTVVETVARVASSGGAPVERLVCHPRLPLVAGLDAERPAVRVWDCAEGRLRELGTVGGESAVYGDALGWDRMNRTPSVTWHPEEPLLVVASEDGVARWTSAALSELPGPPPHARYDDVAFSPDGRTLWASPSSGDEGGAWESSDVVDLASGTVSRGPRWDTGVTEHPAGGLVVTLCSDQGATLGLFARVDPGAPATMRVLRRALVLDCDGYETPVFSADGRHLAIRGNAYDNSLEVFEFPSLRRILATTLGEPSPGYPYPPEWLEQMQAWSRHNIAFGALPGTLWVGTPAGTLVEVDIEGQHAFEHDMLGGAPVTGLAATPTGDLVVATGAGDLVLLAVRAAEARPTAGDASKATVAAFLAATSEVPEDGDLETDLVLTDGTRTWDSADLAAVTEAEATDPTWLRIQAAVNNIRD
ncbi:WD40 repeat domain-containing protein [Streptomyces sp. NPDC047081]|uniref:WD40 repeat domain-containing protein n=1 Tax=Streptomyces sp. NPDC047081 TaxID=3154706 RepID=UPI0033DB0B54